MKEQSTPNSENQKFNEMEINALTALGVALKRIHMRLVREGYIIKDDQIIEPPRLQTNQRCGNM